MKNGLLIATVVGGVVAGGLLLPQAGVAQRSPLNYNAQSNFGGGSLRTGFTPDPWGFRLTAGPGRTGVDVSTLNITDDVSHETCGRSLVSRNPDFHFTFEAGSTFGMVRFYVMTDDQNGDATLLINQPNTHWRCNDDHGHGDWGRALMPAIDFNHPASGRYDIWVGTFNGDSHQPSTLFVTELDSNHPQ